MKYLSVCSGIEAATVAWRPMGWQPVGFSEIEKFPAAVLAHHYPDVPNFGDMTKFEEWPDDIAPDVLVGGTPCQSFSVAGLRKGLDDPRGNLMLTFGSIARRYRTEWLVWENVPGVLSSNGGRDFGTFLGMLAELGYGFAYRVLDAQYFGVAQRRRRVFVVGHLGDWRRAAAVLFERHSLSGHPAPRREAGEAAPTIPSRSTGGGGIGADFDCDGGLIRDWPAQVACTLNAAFGSKMGLEDQHALSGASLFVPATAHTLRGEGFDASEDGTGRGTPLVPVAYRTSPNCGAWMTGDRTDALTTGTDRTSHVLAFNLRGREDGAQPEIDPDNLASLRAASGGSSRSYIANHAVRRLTPRECERLQGFPDDYTRIPTWNGWRDLDACETPEGLMAEGFNVKQSKKTGRWRVRDPDGPRYKAIGNSMAVPVMRWIGERIDMVSAISANQEAA